jgi:hypothetical protein
MGIAALTELPVKPLFVSTGEDADATRGFVAAGTLMLPTVL